MPTSPDPLSAELRLWRIRPPANPNFRPGVWSKIAEPAPATWSSYLFAHRKSWLVTAVATLALAGWAGHSVARARQDAQRHTMAVAYLSDLDPRVQAQAKP